MISASNDPPPTVPMPRPSRVMIILLPALRGAAPWWRKRVARTKTWPWANSSQAVRSIRCMGATPRGIGLDGRPTDRVDDFEIPIGSLLIPPVLLCQRGNG